MNANAERRGWKDLLSYPMCVRYCYSSLLDTLISLLPLPDVEDRYSCMSVWLDDARDQGLLTDNEFSRLRGEIGQHI